jgi:hypothetical protein
MLRGEPLPRPLLLPIVFALGARLENLSLRAFLANPTRIANSQRQIRTVLGLDGVMAYFDPYLEAEAVGCDVKWRADDASCTLHPPSTDVASLRDELSSPEQVANRGRIPVACDVLRRLKTMLMGEPALMAAVSGPALLTDLLGGDQFDEGVRSAWMDAAAEVTAAVSKAFLEAGANVIFIRENGEAIHDPERWVELLSPIVNVIRFYEALPVVLFSGKAAEGAMAALNANSDGAISPVEPGDLPGEIATSAVSAVFLPNACFAQSRQENAALGESLRALSQERRLDVLTTRGDVPPNLDVKAAANVFSELRKVSRVA